MAGTWPSSSFGSPSTSEHTNATLREINDVANRDFEMRPPPTHESLYVVLDTNILLAHLDVVQQFTSDTEALGMGLEVIIPGIVISELDYQKTNSSKYLEWSARSASTWILKKLREKSSVRVQAHGETCRKSGNWKVRSSSDPLETNDGLIVDCCKYFKQLPGSSVAACSGDNNLCIETTAEGILTVSPTKKWSSRELAATMFGANVDLTRFRTYLKTHRPSKVDALVGAMDEVVSTSSVPALPDDGMDIDEDTSGARLGQALEFYPTHILDDLHLQVIDHFTILIVELTVRASESHQSFVPKTNPANRSIHAPNPPPPVNCTGWDARQCLDYLVRYESSPSFKPLRSGTLSRHSAQGLSNFLTRPYAPGARRGQDWTRGDWDVSLKTLRTLGDVWADPTFSDSLAVLHPQVELAFEATRRPTGL